MAKRNNTQSEYIVVSFATKDEEYSVIGSRFEHNMKSLGIPYDLEYIEPIKPNNPSKWLLNEQRKKRDTGRIRAKFLIRKLEEHKKTIMWIDCDDKLKGKPELPNNKYDVGFVQPKKNKNFPISAGVTVFKYTDNALHFLRVWDYLNQWAELEPRGSNHIRLCTAKYLLFDIHERAKREDPYNFKQIDLTNYINPHLIMNGNRK